MAFAARLGALAEQLFDSLTSAIQKTPDERRAAYDACLRKLRAHHYLRINPFEVDDRLDGLDERFRISHRDALADALGQRLTALCQHSCKWHPEILYLLLELSDQPTFKTRLSDLELLLSPPPPPSLPDARGQGPPLRWEQVALEDGWDQDGSLWQSISYGSASNDSSSCSLADSEDDGQRSATDASDGTSLPLDRDTAAPSAQACVVYPHDFVALDAMLDAQAWQSKRSRDDNGQEGPSAPPSTVVVSDVQAVREVLFMLHGLECTLFADCTAAPASRVFRLANTAPETHVGLIRTAAGYGRKLRVLRCFAAEPQASLHLQALQDCLSRRLALFDRQLAGIQARFTSPRADVVVSLTGILAELAPWLKPLMALSSIMARVKAAPGLDTLYYLELLFKETCVAQLTGEPAVYEFLGRAFVECFNVYLRPVQCWMREGKLLPGNDLFFVCERDGPVPLADSWRSRFVLRKKTDGSLHAPAFLQPAVSKICNAGKNMVVLKLLGRYDVTLSQQGPEQRQPLDYDALCPSGFELAPFADLFGIAFDGWIQSQYRKTSQVLKDALLGDWGLSASLDALRSVYLMSDGSASGAFCEALFARLASVGGMDWHNRYALTAAARGAYASLADPGRLSASIDTARGRSSGSHGRHSITLALSQVRISYRLSWPVQMIVPVDSMAAYQSVFTLLSQIKRAMYALCKPRILEDTGLGRSHGRERSLFYLSRNKLVWFCSTLHTYLATLVLDPVEARMRRDLEAAEDIDAMVAAHAAALEQMTEQACLGSRLAPIREAMLDLLDLALEIEDSQHRHAEALDRIASEFDSRVCFVTEGLRSVARASSGSASAKWDILADMLQAGGIGEGC